MKNFIRIILFTWLLSVSSGCVLAQQLGLPAVPIRIEARVVDPDGASVEGATVHLLLPRYREGDRNQSDTALTNEDGIAIVSGIAQQDYKIFAGKNGYYDTIGARRGINDAESFQNYAVGTQKIEMELRPIVNPIPSIVKSVDRKQIPSAEQPVGFDLEVGDWVAPYGIGKVGDFFFAVEGYYDNVSHFDRTFNLWLEGSRNGIVSIDLPLRLGSVFKFPYEAPLTGYTSARSWRNRLVDGSRITDFSLTGERNYIFRIRCQLDEKGDVKYALYGVINGEFKFNRTRESGFNVSFSYALNPIWTRNLEFDREKAAQAGTGKLLIGPPPNE